MKILNYLLPIVAISAALGLYSCDKCRYVDCFGNGFKTIRFLSKTDGTDLIISKQYSLDSLKITALLKNSTGATPPIQVLRYTNGNYDVLLECNVNTAGFIIQLKPLPPDTMMVILGKDVSKCCGTVSTYEKVILNRDTLPLGPYDVSVVLAK